ncbi:NrsF family protein [Kushneria sinocarnis]|uniref:NrsF family protein n=1 Tax=Kushneria sinocarnis TaxID=595502 RepID=UPI003CCC8B1F
MFPVRPPAVPEASLCAAMIALPVQHSLPLLLSVMRQGAASSASSAGTRDRVLTGALSAGAHAWACQNDVGLFLLVRYCGAVALVAVMGAMPGQCGANASRPEAWSTTATAASPSAWRFHRVSSHGYPLPRYV